MADVDTGEATAKQAPAIGTQVTPPAPANQWTPHDGGLEPAPPAPNAAARAVRTMSSAIRRLFGRGS